MNAAEDFMLLILHAHVIAAAKAIKLQYPTATVVELANTIVAKYVGLQGTEVDHCDDKILMYATEVLSLGLLWHGFHDSSREGDGERLLRYWKFLAITFMSSNNYNYAKEAIELLVQYHYILSEREKAQLLWDRCVNTRGIDGANIPCDLHMEHLNRRLKTVIRSMGANISPSAIVKAGKAIAPVQHICQEFEQQTTSNKCSGHHAVSKFGRDFSLALEVLENEQVFQEKGERKHSSYKYRCTLLQKHSQEDMVKKMNQSLKKFHLT